MNIINWYEKLGCGERVVGAVTTECVALFHRKHELDKKTRGLGGNGARLLDDMQHFSLSTREEESGGMKN